MTGIIKSIPCVSAMLLGISATAAFAQNDGIVGSVGLNFGVNFAREVDGVTSSPDTADVGFGIINGEISFPVGQNILMGVDATYRYDDLASSTDFSSTEDPESEATITVRALYKMGMYNRAGVFLNYGIQTPQDGDSDDAYDYAMVGVEGQAMISQDILAYGQLGAGRKVKDGEDSDEGFNRGVVLRTGFAYFLNDRTAVNLDLEYASAQNWIDSSDPGRFYGAYIGGETRLNTAMPLLATYGVSYAGFSGTDEGDFVEEITIGVGIKLLFGANTPRERWTKGIGYGGPRLPVRASGWTEYID